MATSRQTEGHLDNERIKCNIYSAIRHASLRAYALRRGAEPKIKDYSDPFNSGATTALIELQRGLLKLEDLQ